MFKSLTSLLSLLLLWNNHCAARLGDHDILLSPFRMLDGMDSEDKFTIAELKVETELESAVKVELFCERNGSTVSVCDHETTENSEYNCDISGCSCPYQVSTTTTVQIENKITTEEFIYTFSCKESFTPKWFTIVFEEGIRPSFEMGPRITELIVNTSSDDDINVQLFCMMNVGNQAVCSFNTNKSDVFDCDISGCSCPYEFVTTHGDSTLTHPMSCEDPVYPGSFTVEFGSQD